MGRKIEFTHVPGTPSVEIVGVVGDIKEGEMDEDTWPTLYVPFDQSVRILLARSAGIPERGDHSPDRSRHCDLSPRGPCGIESMVPRRRYLRRSSAWLVGAFALVALLLSSVVGMYGVIAYPVSQRTREIGVRIALGAQPKAVYRLIFSDAVRLTAAGLTGLALSVGAASLIRGVLFGVKPWDGGKLALVAAVLGSGGLLASFVPARNAASVDPVEALRAE